MTLSRRNFLKSAAAISIGFTGLHSFYRNGMEVIGDSGPGATPFGPLKEDPSGMFDLPEGFSYRIISRVGDRMDDGFFVPHRADGMAAFPDSDGKGRTLLVRNHEVGPDADPSEGPFGPDLDYLDRISSDDVYDARNEEPPCLGGVTTVVYDTGKQRRLSEHLSLVGTVRNCAGGPTPWNSWISCEESVVTGGEFTKDHGYPFEVPAGTGAGLAQPQPIRAMGRFNHEAVAVDPDSGIVYQTEDREDGLLYRYLPNESGKLQKGGRLQALVVKGTSGLDTRNWDTPTVREGETMPVEWIDMKQVQAPEDQLRYRGHDRGAARFARGEGMWYGNDAVYFACTSGGAAGNGQIWKYTPGPAEGTEKEERDPGKLELFVETTEAGLLENADNLTVSPWGNLIVCEDSDGEQNLVGVTPEGKLYRFARNAMSDSELAGSTFSPDGSTLFVNIQHEGLTLAVTGPWKKRG